MPLYLLRELLRFWPEHPCLTAAEVLD